MTAEEQAQQDFNEEYSRSGVKRSAQPLFNVTPEGNPGLMPNTAKLPSQASNLLPGQSISDLTFQSGISQRRIRVSMNPVDNPDQSAGSIYIIDEDNNILFAAGEASTVFTAELTVQDFTGRTGVFVNRVAGAGVTSNDLVIFDDNDLSSTGTVLLVDNSGQGIGVSIQQRFATTQPGLEVQTLATSDAPAGAFLSRGGGDGLEVFTQGSNNGAFIYQQNVANTNAPLYIANEYVQSTHFTPLVTYDPPFAGSIIGQYMSDGTSPNGLLTAHKGSVCFNGDGGKMYYNTDGSTSWTAA